jgi:hypothetical protein
MKKDIDKVMDHLRERGAESSHPFLIREYPHDLDLIGDKLKDEEYLSACWYTATFMCALYKNKQQKPCGADPSRFRPFKDVVVSSGNVYCFQLDSDMESHYFVLAAIGDTAYITSTDGIYSKFHVVNHKINDVNTVIADLTKDRSAMNRLFGFELEVNEVSSIVLEYFSFEYTGIDSNLLL